MTARLSSSTWWLLLFAAAAMLWGVHITRPVDLPFWHEFDSASVARNFLREDNNILYPRIDWRGNGPGYTEMEFPILPWTMAQLYRLAGVHEIIGRFLSLASMLWALAFFVKLARRFLSPPAVFAAAFFFLTNHLVVQTATTLQPEALMLAFSVASVYFFVEWYQSKSWLAYALALITFASAMLVKLPSAHLALFFLLWSLHHDRTRAFRRPSLYLFAALAFAPVIAWHIHAAAFWHLFHNSMGVSNEDHWIGLDLLRRPKVLLNFIGIDMMLAGAGGGIVVAFIAIFHGRIRTAVNQLALSWSAAVMLYLIVILRTSAAYWAAYYHVALIPPLALLFGAGVDWVRSQNSFSWHRIFPVCVVCTLLISPLFLLSSRSNITALPGVFQDLLVAHSSFPALLVMGATSLLLTGIFLRAPRQRQTSAFPLQSGMAIAGCFLYFVLSGQMLLGSWQSLAIRSPDYATLACFSRHIPPNTLIIASGGICYDPGGHRLANNAPEEFYWLDRKGFSTCQGHESIGELKSFVSNGARYFIAEKISLASQPQFEAELRRLYTLVADCHTATLFYLGSPGKY